MTIRISVILVGSNNKENAQCSKLRPHVIHGGGGLSGRGPSTRVLCLLVNPAQVTWSTLKQYRREQPTRSGNMQYTDVSSKFIPVAIRRCFTSTDAWESTLSYALHSRNKPTTSTAEQFKACTVWASFLSAGELQTFSRFISLIDNHHRPTANRWAAAHRPPPAVQMAN